MASDKFLRQAKEWLGTWKWYSPDVAQMLTVTAVERAITQHYAGGITQFVRDHRG